MNHFKQKSKINHDQFFKINKKIQKDLVKIIVYKKNMK